MWHCPFKPESEVGEGTDTVWHSPFKPESEVGRGGHSDYVAQSI